MEFRILGPLYADAGTGRGPAVIGQPLLQSALALLLLRANRPCPRGMLIEALWGSERGVTRGRLACLHQSSPAIPG